MAGFSLAGNRGVYGVDWEAVARLCRSYVRAESTLKHARIGRETHLFGPDVAWVEVDWKAVRTDVEKESAFVYQELQRTANQSIDRAADYVRTILSETETYRRNFQTMQTNCSRTTMQNINRSVEWGKTGVKWATAIRDFSADFVMVGATALSGGAAAAAIGGGSLLKGSYKWQDTKSFSSGLFTASTELLFAVIPLKVKGTGVVKEQITKLILAKVKAGTEIAKTVYIDHKTFAEGAVSGLLKMNDPALMMLAKEWLKGADAKTQLIAVPVVAALKFARDLGIRQISNAAAPKPVATSKTPQPSSPLPIPYPNMAHSILDAAPFEQCDIAQMGICRM